MGVRPDFTVAIRLDILREGDGPMLRHGLQGIQGARIFTPWPEKLRPNVQFLAGRYELFKNAT
jgi:putative restriction endonuclease